MATAAPLMWDARTDPRTDQPVALREMGVAVQDGAGAPVAAPEVADKLARDLGVVTIPGSYFGKGLDRHLRIAFANVDAAGIGQLAERLGELGR